MVNFSTADNANPQQQPPLRPPHGFRKPPQPSKAKALGQLKVMREHLTDISTYCQAMQEACWKILRLAHSSAKGLTMRIFAGPKAVEDIRVVLGGIADLCATYAADWKAQGDPDFNKKAWLSNINAILADNPVDIQVVNAAEEHGKAVLAHLEKAKGKPFLSLQGFDDCIMGFEPESNRLVYNSDACVFKLARLKKTDPAQYMLSSGILAAGADPKFMGEHEYSGPPIMVVMCGDHHQ